MAQIRKYAFDTEFAPDGAIVKDGPKKQTAEEIAADCAAAYERGKQDAVAQAERQAAAALQVLADAASAVLTRLDVESKAMREEAAHIAIAAANKIAGAALDGFGADRAAAAIEAAMDALRHQPRLVVKLAPEAAETLKPRIAAMCETHAYAGAILVRAEPGFKTGEVVIDWSDGVIALDPAEAADRINALMKPRSRLHREAHMSTDMKLDEFTPTQGDGAHPPESLERSAADLAAVYDVPVHIQAVLGRANMEVAALLRLARGSVIELDRKVGEAIDIYVNNRLVARGEVVVVDERLGVTMTEIIKDGDAA